MNVDIGEALGSQDQHGGEKVNEVQDEFVGFERGTKEQAQDFQNRIEKASAL